MSKAYRAIVAVADRFVPSKLRPLWEHDAGPKTIFFWAPAFKWVEDNLLWVLTVIWGYVIYFYVIYLDVIAHRWAAKNKNESCNCLVDGHYTTHCSSGRPYRMCEACHHTGVHGTKALVLASLDEYRRPLDKVSTTQSATLAATGLIWTRYCLVIRPINYSLSLCNFSLGMANAVQCARALRHQRRAQLAAVRTS